MESTTMQIQSSLEANQQKHIMFGNILQLQIILKQRKAEPRMLVVFFLKNYSLVAALPEPLQISWRVLSWAKSKQACKHVLQSISDFPVVHTGAHCAHQCTLCAHCAHCAHCQRASKSHFRHAFRIFLLHSVELLG